jgi:ubiquitin carboxyl-terminal hydrolase 7
VWRDTYGLLTERRLDEERLQSEARKKEREEQHLFLTAKVWYYAFCGRVLFLASHMQVITDETFARHEGFDLATFEDKNWPPSELPTFRVLKQEPYNVFKGRVAKHFGCPESQIRLWVLVNRQNKTVRPDTAIPENEPSLSM